ncbi:MAG: hypothetical protein FD174_1929 [Geobacteraceae bacterium]|nr:MAG: hypothetical protein FD174_1929 [Geobacteraceae bacterium]
MEGCRLSGGGREAVRYGTKELMTTVLRLLLGGVFLYAGITKIAAPTVFAGSLAAYKILPYFGNYLVASILPWVEALCGLLLIAGYRVKAAVSLIIALNIVFMAALASTIIRGLDIDCGCFRQGGEKTSAWTALLRDVAFLITAVVVMTGTKTKEKKFF